MMMSDSDLLKVQSSATLASSKLGFRIGVGVGAQEQVPKHCEAGTEVTVTVTGASVT
jgi:hypothetical protein